MAPTLETDQYNRRLISIGYSDELARRWEAPE
jgi:hypothetical protein